MRRQQVLGGGKGRDMACIKLEVIAPICYRTSVKVAPCDQ